jgi:F0F1-type ATP synthase assembly protein I
MRYAGLGVQLAVSLLVFVLVGQWLDKRLGNTGIVTMVAAFVGFGGTMYSLIRTLNRQDGADRNAVGQDNDKDTGHDDSKDAGHKDAGGE